jgi:WD40 repeat protein
MEVKHSSELLKQIRTSDPIQMESMADPSISDLSRKSPVTQSATEGFIYDGFLSYSSRSDYQTARRLESFLESFHKAASRSAIIRPLQICRDGSDFRIPGRRIPDIAEDAVMEIVSKELVKSRVLLVLCSPAAVQSDYVRKEIAFWFRHCPDRMVFPLLTESKDPVKAPEESFPGALIEKRLNHATIWYDLRSIRKPRQWPWQKQPANGFRNAEDELVRLAGDLLEWNSAQNGPIATIWEREQLRRKRNIAKAVSAVAILFMVLAGFAVYSAVRATQQQRTARANAIAIAADSSPDPLLGSLLLTELADLPQPSDGMRVARKLAVLTVSARVLSTSSPITRAALSPDERQVLAVNNKGRATLFALDGTGTAISFQASNAPSTPVCNAPQQLYLNSDSATDAAFSPDGTYFATASLDGRVRLWRPTQAGPVLSKSLNAPADRVAFSADGKWVFTNTSAGALYAFAVDGPACYSAALPNNRRILAAQFPSAEGAGLVIGDDNSVWDFSFDKGINLRKLPVPAGGDAAVGQLAVIAEHADWVLLSDPYTTVWFSTRQGGKAVKKQFAPASPDSASFSPDGTRLAIATSDGKIHMFDSSSGAEQMPPISSSIHFQVTDIDDNKASDSAWNITRLLFTRDNSALVATSNSGTMRMWNLKTRAVQQEMRASFAESAIFTHDEKTLVTYGLDGKVRIWRLQQENEPQVLLHDQPVESAQFLPDGRSVITRTRGGKALFWGAGARDPVLLEPASGVKDVKTFNKGAVLVYADRIAMWNFQSSGKLLPGLTFSDPSLPRIAGAEVTHDGARVVAWSSHGDVVAWTADDPAAARKTHLGYDLKVPMRWDTALSTALSQTSDGKLQAWSFQDFEHPRVIWERADKQSQGFKLSASGSLALYATRAEPSAGQQAAGICRVSFLKTARTVDLKFAAADDQIDGCFFTPDEKHLLLTSVEGRAWLFELSHPESHQELHDATGFAHQGMMADPVFSADGKRIVTFGSIDGMVRIWSLPEGTVDVLEGHGGAILSGAISQDMSRVVSASEDLSARVWRTDWRDLLRFLRARTTANLSVPQRMQFLGETENEARSRK